MFVLVAKRLTAQCMQQQDPKQHLMLKVDRVEIKAHAAHVQSLLA